MNSHHRSEMFRNIGLLSLCRFVLCMALYNSAFFGSVDALPGFNVEELCRDWRTVTIDLRHYQSGTVTSLTSGAQELTCTIQFKTSVDSSVVLSLYKFSLEPQEQLVIEDAQNFKVSLIGEGDFSDERQSFQSDGDMTLHYSKNGTYDFGSSRTKFQFTFTGVHRSPCGYEEFECRNLNCIPKNLLCNRHNNCGDNSDEKDCSPRNKVDDELPWKEVIVTGNVSAIWIIIIIICAALLGINIIVFAVVLIRRCVAKKKKEEKNVNLSTIASSAPPTAAVQPPMVPSMVTHVRPTFQRAKNVQSAAQERIQENYQVPSMYPELPSAPEYYAGVDNPEFKADE